MLACMYVMTLNFDLADPKVERETKQFVGLHEYENLVTPAEREDQADRDGNSHSPLGVIFQQEHDEGIKTEFIQPSNEEFCDCKHTYILVLAYMTCMCMKH